MDGENNAQTVFLFIQMERFFYPLLNGLVDIQEQERDSIFEAGCQALKYILKANPIAHVLKEIKVLCAVRVDVARGAVRDPLAAHLIFRTVLLGQHRVSQR